MTDILSVWKYERVSTALAQGLCSLLMFCLALSVMPHYLKAVELIMAERLNVICLQC